MTVTERFLKYVTYHTTSDGNSETVPSTEGQKVLGACLAEELKNLGLVDAEMDECGYVYGYLPGSKGCEAQEAIGFIAHMDTVSGVSGEHVQPRVVVYDGGDIQLGETEWTLAQDNPELAGYVGQELIVTDGTTLLGADDKAGVAEIMALCELLVTHPEIPHRPVMVCFTPDEEIGRGSDHFNFEKFLAKVAYTVDGGELGEIEYENFNGASARIEIHGVNIHPGSAKNKMKNAVLLAAELVNFLPSAEIPAHTEGYEGFYHVSHVEGDESAATVRMIIRDHDREKFEGRKQFVARLVEYLNAVHGEGTFRLTMKDSYYNMKEKILPHMELIHNAEAAMRAVGVEPKVVAIRGGTDGAVLSYKGLPCPNLSTGGINIHGVHEYIPVQSLEKMVEVLKTLAAPVE